MRSLVLAILTLALTFAVAGPATAAIDPQPGFGPSLFSDEIVPGPTKWVSELGSACDPMTTDQWRVATFGTNYALTDSLGLNYKGAGCYTAIRTDLPINLSSSPYCRVFFRMILQIVGNDHFVVQSAPSGAPEWLDERFFLAADNVDAFRAESVRIGRSSGAAVYLRFLMHGFGTSTGDGVYLDEFDVRCDTIAASEPHPGQPEPHPRRRVGQPQHRRHPDRRERPQPPRERRRGLLLRHRFEPCDRAGLRQGRRRIGSRR